MSGALPLALLAVFATLVWWGATGLLLLLTARNERTFGRSVAATTLVAIGGIAAIVATRDVETPFAAIVAFLSAISVWAAIELAFLMGFVVGPNRQPCPAGARALQRFSGAFWALAYHELALIAAMGLVHILTAGGANRLAFDLFALMWVMRLSTKLNIFFGVANASAELLPERISYLKTYFGQARINVFFPISVTAASALTVLLGWLALTGTKDFATTSYALLAAFAALAVLEHWTLVVPLPASVLWPWSGPSDADETQRSTDATRSLPGVPAGSAMRATAGNLVALPRRGRDT